MDRYAGAMLRIDQAEVDRLARAIVSETLEAQTRAVQAATRRLEKDFEAMTRAAVPGKAWRAWTSKVYPSRPVAAYRPTGEVFGKGGSRTQGMLSYWSLPGTNRAKHGDYLAVPLKAALGTYAGETITPRRWEGIFKTPLRPYTSKKGQLLLVADGFLDGHGFFVPVRKGREKLRGGQKMGDRRTVAVFALIAVQEHANTVSLEGAIAAAEAFMVQDFGRRLDRMGS